MSNDTPTQPGLHPDLADETTSPGGHESPSLPPDGHFDGGSLPPGTRILIERFDTLREILMGVAERTNTGLNRVAGGFVRLETGVDALRHEVMGMRTEMAGMHDRLLQLEDRVAKLERERGDDDAA